MEERSRRGRGGKIGRWIAFLVVGPLMVFALWVVAVLRAPPSGLMLDELRRTFRTETGYTLSFGKASSVVTWPRGVVDLRDVTVSRPTLLATTSSVFAEAKRITADFDVAGLLGNQNKLTAVVIDAPRITLGAEDVRRLEAARGRRPGLEMGNVMIANGVVNYRDKLGGPDVSFTSIAATLAQVSASRIGDLSGRFDWRGATVTIAGAVAPASENRANLTLDLKTAVGQATLRGALNYGTATRFEGDAKFSVVSLAEAQRFLGADGLLDTPVLSGSATIKGPIAFSKRQLWLMGAKVASEIADGQADVALDWRNERPRITGKAAWRRLDITPFLPVAQRPPITNTLETLSPQPVEVPSGWQDIESYLDQLADPAASSRSLAAPISASTVPPSLEKIPLSPRNIDFSFLDFADVDLAQTSGTLVVGNINLSDVDSVIRLDGGKLHVDVKRGRWADGDWTAKLEIHGRAASTSHALVLTGKRADARPIQNLLVGQAALEGLTDVTADLTAHGNNLDAVLQSLTGKAGLELSDGRMIGFDLRSLLRCWCKRTYDRRNVTPFDTIKARLRLRNGVVGTVGPATLRSRHVELDTSGTVSLTQQRLDQKLRARPAPPSNQLPFPLHISGSWQRPRIALDLGIFSLLPDSYDLPFQSSAAAAMASVPAFEARSLRSKSFETGRSDVPEQLKAKIRNALTNPRTAEKIPPKLQTIFKRLVEGANKTN